MPSIKDKVLNNQDLMARRDQAVPRGPYSVTPIFADRALGSRLWDVEGNCYIDFTGGIGTLNVGHNHPRVVAAIKAQADRFIHTSWHVVMYEDYVRLAERLNQAAPMPAPCKTMFLNSGAEAVENAIKIARIASRRQAVVCFERAFHGRTLLAMSLTGKVQPYTAGFGPFAPEIYRLPYEPFYQAGEHSGDGSSHGSGNDARAVETQVRAAFDHLFSYSIDPASVACLIMEPVLGEGGFLPAHPEAIRLTREICREQGILFIADEVQSGFGRCGALFACERYDIEPDLLTFAKSVAGGVPLSGVTGRAAVMDSAHVGGLGGTFGGNPLACAAGNAVLDIMEEENLPARAETLGTTILAAFARLAGKHPHAGRQRGLGAMCALELIDPKTGEPDAERARTTVAAARAAGLLIMTASGNVIRTLMPLNIPDEDLEEGLAILGRAVAAAR